LAEELSDSEVSRRVEENQVSESRFANRVTRCAELMRTQNIDVILLTRPSNMFYLTGDGRLCAYAMISQSGQVVMGVPKTDVVDVKSSARFDHISGFDDEVGMIHSIGHHFEHFGVKEGVVGLEYTFLTRSMMSMMMHPHAKPEHVNSADCTHIMSELRSVKDEEEIRSIRAAAKVADRGMNAAIVSLQPRMTESQVAAEAEYAMRQAGAEGFWRTYVSSGPRTSIAHGIPTIRKLKKEDLVMIDVHPIVQGYSADICRTMCIGHPTREQQSSHDQYLQAQQAAIAEARAGVTMDQLEQAMHEVLIHAGHQNHIFGPPIHGVGIEFEEAPLPSGHAFFHGEKAPPPLKTNTVIAVGNCGLYIDDFGVRVEDTIVIGKAKADILTKHTREMKM